MNNITTIAVIVLGLVIAVVAFRYLNTPQSASTRFDNATEQLGNGNLGEAIDELNNKTKGDKIGDDINDVMNTNPVPHAQTNP